MKLFLGIEVKKIQKGIFKCQRKYAIDILTIFKISNCKLASTLIPIATKLSKEDKIPFVNPTLYKQLLRSLMYLTTTKPDNMYAVNIISKFMESPKDSHWKIDKRILRCIAGTTQHDIMYKASKKISLLRYTNSDFTGSIDDWKGTSSCAFQLGTNLISWTSNKQPIVTLSSTKVEYEATTSTTCHTIWLKTLLGDLEHKEKETTPILCDNNSAIALSNNHVFHCNGKHIETHFHFI